MKKYKTDLALIKLLLITENSTLTKKKNEGMLFL